MQRVAVLSHVKASSVPPSLSSSGARRIPWHGGKISSNKEEALRKFYERKLRAGDSLAAQQIEAMQKTLGVTLDAPQKKNSKKEHAIRRSHAKATPGQRTVLKTGRVLGPKVNTKLKAKKSSGNAKLQAARKPKTVVKMLTERAGTGPAISLEDKLDLPLDALVGGKNKRSGGVKRR